MENYYINEETPEHLDGIKKLVNEHGYESEWDDAAYAEIAFALLKAAEGDKDAVKNIANYLQDQHRQYKNLAERYNKLKSGVSQWVKWAALWTQRKAE